MNYLPINFTTVLGLSACALLSAVACSGDDDDGITLPQGGKGGSAGRPARGGSSGSGGSGALNSNGGEGAGEAGAGHVGESGSGGSSAGEGGRPGTGGKGGSAGKGGSSAQGSSGAPSGAGGEDSIGGTPGSTGGEGGAGGDGTAGDGGEDPPVASACIFHSPPQLPTGGEGGAGPALSGVKIVNNTFLGPYLTDSAGFTLYIYGADVPGDCNNAPVSNCYADCAISWPIFDAHARELDPALDDSVFGTIDRGDGTFQTTYFGWPLYYYKSDLTVNTINGQNKAKTWYAAETKLPNLMIMRTPVAGGGLKYLSDDRGYTLYSFASDTVGTGDADPVSACTGACLDTFAPFAPDEVFPVTYLEPHDVRFFFRADGTYQVAFKGAPLYYSRADLRAAEQNGLLTAGFALVLQ